MGSSTENPFGDSTTSASTPYKPTARLNVPDLLQSPASTWDVSAPHDAVDAIADMDKLFGQVLRDTDCVYRICPLK